MNAVIKKAMDLSRAQAAVLLALCLAAAAYGGASLRPSPAPEPLVRFGLITDLHYADRDPAGGRMYRESTAKLAEFAATMNGEKADFVIELGDFKDQDVQPDPVRTLSFLRTIEAVFARFKGPRYHVLGNHDEDSLTKAEFLGAAVNTGIPEGRTYYSFDVKGVHFVVLDPNFRSDGRAFARGAFTWDDCNLPAAELEWLKADLASGRGPAVVFIHQQLDGTGAYYVKNAAEARGILAASGRVRVVFQGHRHEGAFSEIDGVVYCTIKAAGEGSGPENNGYVLAEAEAGGGIRINGYHKIESLKIDRREPAGR
jgi:predicted phosphodiesterase